jgi:tetratricopeptide (TPR) repeat protein
VLEIRPDWPMALQNIGLLLFTIERYEEGLQYFLRALALDPTLLERQASSGLPIVAQSTPVNTAMFSYYMARVSATAGNLDLTMSYLYRAVEEGVTDRVLLSDDAFSILNDDARYVTLLASLETP